MSEKSNSPPTIANQWRRFNFFDVTPITDPNDPPIYSDNQVMSAAPGKDLLYLGTRDGNIRAVSKDLQLIVSWSAHSGGSIDFLHAHPTLNILVSVSHTQGQATNVALWNVKSTPKLISTAKVTNGLNTQPLTAFSCSEDASVLAFGYADGAVVVLRGDLVHDRGSRQRSVVNCGSPITGLFIVGDNAFVVSLQQVLVVSTNGSKTQKVLEKSKGAALDCSALFGEQLVICRADEISFYHIDHRGASREFLIPKKALYVYKHYLVMVTIHKMLGTDTYRVVIVDTLNDLIPYDGQLSLNVRHIFVQWNQLNVIGSNANGDGTLYVLREKSITQQLDILKQQMLFPVAIKLAENAKADDKVVMSLHQDYGDYLDEKGDSELALKHYLAAIDLGDTSHVIMRYKDTHKVAILATYLEALESRKLASSAHLTLLMVCYTNLKDTAKLMKFVERATALESFDFSSAIDLCRKSEYSKIAAFIAEKWPDPDLVVQIKLRDLKDYLGCLDYIRTISVSDALWALIQNSRVLLNELPVETTSILILLFTGKFVPKASETARHEHDLEGARQKTTTPLLQSYQAFMSYITLNKSDHVDHEVLDSDQYEVTYQPPRPVLIFPSFIGHNNEFVIFLEACLENADQFQPSQKDLSDIVTTLYQVYLSLAKENKESDEWLVKSHALIEKHHELLDSNTVLMVTKMNNIKLSPDQVIRLGGSYIDIFRDFIERNKPEKALEVVEKVMADSKNAELNELLLLVLETLASDEQFFRVVEPQFTIILSKCTSLNIVSPVQLIGIICKSSFITVGDMKPFLLEQIKRDQTEITNNGKVTELYRKEIDTNQKEIDALVNDPIIIQNGNCSVCSMALELPAVHFTCGHSFHKRCLGDSTKCPLCVAELESINAIRSAELQTAARTDVFMGDLDRTKDQLKAITDYISRGALIGK